MKDKNKLIVEIKGNKVRTNYGQKTTRGQAWTECSEEQIGYLKKFEETGKFEYLGDFMNVIDPPERTNYLLIAELLFGFTEKNITKITIEKRENPK